MSMIGSSGPWLGVIALVLSLGGLVLPVGCVNCLKPFLPSNPVPGQSIVWNGNAWVNAGSDEADLSA